MKTVPVSLNSIDKVKEFVSTVNKFDCDFDIAQHRYVIDAKSMLGIFSLDLSSSVDLIIHENDEAKTAKILESLNKFLA